MPRRPLLEIILDPRTIQWLLGLGGALLVVGLVIWLAAVGVFENPVVVAVALGIANAAVLVAGWATIRFTRYQTVGRAITLAGLFGDAVESLVLPCPGPDYDRRTIFGGRRWSVACSTWLRRWCCAITCSSTCLPAESP